LVRGRPCGPRLLLPPRLRAGGRCDRGAAHRGGVAAEAVAAPDISGWRVCICCPWGGPPARPWGRGARLLRRASRRPRGRDGRSVELVRLGPPRDAGGQAQLRRPGASGLHRLGLLAAGHAALLRSRGVWRAGAPGGWDRRAGAALPARRAPLPRPGPALPRAGRPLTAGGAPPLYLVYHPTGGRTPLPRLRPWRRGCAVEG